MSETINKMARAMCVADGFDPDGLVAYAKSGQAVARHEWGIYLARARAALTAMSEPSDAMVARSPHSTGGYRAMIQAALEEPTSETDQLGGVAV